MSTRLVDELKSSRSKPKGARLKAIELLVDRSRGEPSGEGKGVRRQAREGDFAVNEIAYCNGKKGIFQAFHLF